MSNPTADGLFIRMRTADYLQAIADTEAAARAEEREACAAKIEEQSRLMTIMFGSDRHESVCRDLAKAVRAIRSSGAATEAL